LKMIMVVVKIGEIMEEIVDMAVAEVAVATAEEVADTTIIVVVAGEAAEVDIKEEAEAAVATMRTETVAMEAEDEAQMTEEEATVEETITEINKMMEIGVEDKPANSQKEKATPQDSPEEEEEEEAEATSDLKQHHILARMPRSFRNQGLKTQLDVWFTSATYCSMLMSKISWISSKKRRWILFVPDFYTTTKETPKALVLLRWEAQTKLKKQQRT